MKPTGNISGLVPLKKKKPASIRRTTTGERLPPAPKEHATVSLQKRSSNPTLGSDGSVLQCMSVNTKYWPGNNPLGLCDFKDKEARKRGGKCYSLARAVVAENALYFQPCQENPGGSDNYVRKFRRNKQRGRGYYFTHVHETDDVKFEFTGQKKHVEVTQVELKANGMFKIVLPAHIKLSVKED